MSASAGVQASVRALATMTLDQLGGDVTGATRRLCVRTAVSEAGCTSGCSRTRVQEPATGGTGIQGQLRGELGELGELGA